MNLFRTHARFAKQWNKTHRNVIIALAAVRMKSHLHAYGGKGYDHVPVRFVPLLRETGVSPEEIHAMTVTNPAEAYDVRPRGALTEDSRELTRTARHEHLHILRCAPDHQRARLQYEARRRSACPRGAGRHECCGRLLRADG